MTLTPSRPENLSAAETRRCIRRGEYTGQTSGLAPGFVQGNLAILPEAVAHEFLVFCQRNPKPCPVIGVSEPGAVGIPTLGADLDLRRDVPRYRVWRKGEIVEECTDVDAFWRDDLVAFVIGCSFSFEEALITAGVPLRHIDRGHNMSMYDTSLATAPVGRFGGPMVVTMRPMSPVHAIRAIQITSRFPAVHGAPVHLGDPRAIGIADLSRPDYGDPTVVDDGEIPVFWACGVTPQAVIRRAKVDFCITHAPGCMLITDARNADLAVL